MAQMSDRMEEISLVTFSQILQRSNWKEETSFSVDALKSCILLCCAFMEADNLAISPYCEFMD